MQQNVLYEMELILLVMFSVIMPVAIYGFLYKKLAVSRWAVVGFAILLVIVSGIDVILLQSLSETAKATESLIDDKIFSGQLSLALYLFPAVFAGLGMSLLSHVLVNHLNEAEQEYDKEHRGSGGRGADSEAHGPWRIGNSGSPSEAFVLMGSAVGTAAIFVLDVLTGAEIRLHVLYVFPLAMVARHCAGLAVPIAALFVTTILQVITFSAEAEAIQPFITDICIALAASLLIIFLARRSRDMYLLAVDQAATDPLTGLTNRRAFMAAVESEITRQRRYGGTFCLAVLDLDGFKALNDSKGHVAGDEALKLTANILRNCTRASDSVGRIGGDEFAILTPNTQHVNGGLMVHNLHATMAQRMAAAGFAITASIGCTIFTVPPENTSDALEQADKIMYDNKRRGKNRGNRSDPIFTQL